MRHLPAGHRPLHPGVLLGDVLVDLLLVLVGEGAGVPREVKQPITNCGTQKNSSVFIMSFLFITKANSKFVK